MKTILKLTTLILLLIFTFSCSKDDNGKTEPEIVTNVYAVGAIIDEMQNPNPIATIWKNGVRTPLSNGANGAAGRSVFVTDNGDEYVAGIDGKVAVVWKNGIKTPLTDGTYQANANSVFVLGNDVYVSGYETLSNGYSVVNLWKNGIKRTLSDGLNYAEAYSVFVSGNDVYVAGIDYILYPNNLNRIAVACIWKNGIRTALPDNPASSISSKATSVFISGTDVYVAGYERNPNNVNVAKLWKNGVANTLSNGLYDAGASSVYVLGTEVYTIGYEAGNGVLWKNNLPPVSLINPSYAASVFVSGDDVYIGGHQKDNAIVWKNGVATNLNDGAIASVITSVFVTKK